MIRGTRPGAHALRRLSRARATGAVGAAALVVLLLRLLHLHRPALPDEAGFLMVAAQWSPGRSLYGDYWVDRPPLLIDVFAAAHVLGGLTALRVIGCLAAVAAVLVAGRIGRVAVGSPSGALVTGGVAAILTANPLLGTREVNGELLASPLVLVGILGILEAARRPPSRARTGWLLLAGAAAAAAVHVKQSMLDVLVVAAVASVTLLPRPGARVAWRELVAVAVGSCLVTAVLLGQAAALGTSPAGLWDALVTFRVEAGTVIEDSASGDTRLRFWQLLGAFTLSGAPLLVVALARSLPARPLPDGLRLRAPAVTLLVWEALVVLAGGSYWVHYLTGLIPGLVLAAAVIATAPAPDGRQRGLPRAAIACLAASAVVAATVVAVWPAPPRRGEESDWLEANARPTDTAVVAYGHPEILTQAGLSSPYVHLWSLPVRVRDPDLRGLTAVLSSSDRPDWVLADGSGLASWGIDHRRGEAALARYYRPVAEVGGQRIFLVRGRSLDD